MSILHTSLINSPIGNLSLGVINHAVVMLEYDNPQRIETHIKKLVTAHPELKITHNDHPLTAIVQSQIDEFFSGKRGRFDLCLDPVGTPFQKQVWAELQNIPYGETISYAEGSRRLNRLKSFRAVANANGQNPISIIIPCHRVVCTSGDLGGYAGGIEKKKFLIEHEKKSNFKS